MSDFNSKLLSARWNVHQATARVTFIIYLFGDELAKRHGYDVGGLEAVALYLPTEMVFHQNGLSPTIPTF